MSGAVNYAFRVPLDTQKYGRGDLLTDLDDSVRMDMKVPTKRVPSVTRIELAASMRYRMELVLSVHGLRYELATSSKHISLPETRIKTMNP
ncbi:MAG TPA: hypothetical protein VLL06_09595 [Nitrospiraceae bacterium]|nr:hypothetical protein [Nitrospiraceae bacterium]